MIAASPTQLLILAVVGLFAGWVNTVAGAGSLLLLPALVWSGLPDDAANATNRLGILAQTTAAVLGYRRAGIPVGRAEATLTVPAAIGAALGAWWASSIEAADVRTAVLIAMGVALVLTLVPMRVSTPPMPLPRATPGTVLALFAIGLYGGFLQAGVGLLVLLYLARAHRVSLVTANVLKSALVLALSIIALSVFAVRGETIDPLRGGVLACSSALGAVGGARATLRIGERLVRIFMMLATAATMLALLLDGR